MGASDTRFEGPAGADLIARASPTRRNSEESRWGEILTHPQHPEPGLYQQSVQVANQASCESSSAQTQCQAACCVVRTHQSDFKLGTVTCCCLSKLCLGHRNLRSMLYVVHMKHIAPYSRCIDYRVYSVIVGGSTEQLVHRPKRSRFIRRRGGRVQYHEVQCD